MAVQAPSKSTTISVVTLVNSTACPLIHPRAPAGAVQVAVDNGGAGEVAPLHAQQTLQQTSVGILREACPSQQ
jgi:hypothetical protein